MSNITEAQRNITLTPVTADAIAAGEFVKITSAGLVQVCNTAGEFAIGIAVEGSAAMDSKAIPVALLDGAKSVVIAGGTFSAGDAVMTDGSGHAVEHTTGNTVLGYALFDAVDTQLVAIVGKS